MQDESPAHASQHDNNAKVTTTDIDAYIITSSAEDISPGGSDVAQVTDDVDAPVTITRTTTITNSSNGSVIHE